MSLKGKKLLILAASHNEVPLVKRAKELGVYTIVTDYYDVDKSPAKKVADEYWNISWSDTEALAQKCIDCHVDGITGGYSEFVVEAVIKLCDRLNLPCYCTEEQLEITRDKIKFKETCRKNKVPVVYEYASVDEVNKYPVIVKPVDRAGSIGISVATNRAELEKAYAYAMEMSVCKQVIIEDYISSGRKFDALYAICNGKISYLSSSDTISAKNNGLKKVVQSGWTFPSKYEGDYLRSVDAAMRDMIADMNITDGYIFFSGFAIPGEKTEFVFFESGFRLSGGHLYSYIRRKGNSDIQDIFITHALLGRTDGISFDETKGADLKCLMVNYYASKGVIENFDCVEDIKKMPDCTLAIQMAQKGTECHDDQAILKKLAMFHFCNESVEVLKQDLMQANSLMKVTDPSGKDMVYDRIDSDLLDDAWIIK